MTSKWTRTRARIAGATALAVAATGVVATPVTAAPPVPAPWRSSVQAERSVPGKDLPARSKPADPAASSVLRTAPPVAWPAAGESEVSLTGERARAGRLPVSLGGTATGRAKVRVLDRSATERAGVSGLLFTVTGAQAGRLDVEVDYSSFRSAYGGDWASRLRLVELPACALSTPELSQCRAGRSLPTRNAVREGRLTAGVAVSATATVLAAAAAPAGSGGDYTATPLSASSSWEAGGSAGDFTWKYPMEGVPAFGGPEPDLDLSYSSGSVDGRTASTNNQSSWVGEGWDLTEGFIERRYKSCSDDVTFTPKPYDMCWETDNAFLSLGSKSTELVKDDTTGVWRLRSDDGSRVERLTGITNFDNDGEYWKLTTRDGTQYFFGMHRLPGWTDGGAVTQSVWTVPVFGNDSGEPCHASTFAASYCDQAWRWNLDYVVDPNGNAMSYWYTKDWNYYGRNRTASAGTDYVRNGSLTRVDYGQRSGTVYSASAPMRVVFATQERCAAGATCGTGAITKDTAKNWPDVPYDQACASGATCTDLFAPTFWSRKRLASVTTQVLVSGTTYKDVDSWALGYQFREPGDGTSPSLWLASITRSGKVGGSAALPAVTFEGTQLENRVDAEEGIPPLYKWRLTDMYDEAGGHVRVNYSGKECTRAAAPTPDSNTKRCFPQYWVPEGATAPQRDWFHKYVAVQVLEDDQSGAAGIEQTDYEYLGGGAWHYDDNELTPAKYRTWSEWRGYARVRVTHGATGEVRSQSESLFFRGMNGDKLSSGTRSASVTDSEGVAVADHPAFAGVTRESITYDGVGGAVLDGMISDPWVSAATSTRGSTNAYLTGEANKRSRLALSAGGWRRGETRTTFDSYGLPSQVNDLGDTSTSTDDKCNRTTYARDTTKWMLDYEVRDELVGVACDATTTRPADVVSDVRTFYDGSTTFGTAPVKGDVTLTQEVAAYSGSTPSYVQSSRATFDAYGRTLVSYDALNRATTTAFTPATGAPATATTLTNPLGHVVTRTLDTARGDEIAIVDANGRRTDMTYDPLGRLTAVWLGDQVKADGEAANLTFSYLVSTTAPNVVTTQSLRDDGGYDPAYALYDGRLRPRQTQEPAAGGGRVVTDTFYDSRGLAVKANGAYWNSGTAGTTLLTVTDNTVQGQTRNIYDGAERETAKIFLSYGTEKWRTTTSYGGDRTHVDPPTGGTATTTITDAAGKTTELRQYASGTPSGSYDATKYTYTKAGDLDSVTDAAGNVWSYGYDLRGRKIRNSDPDKGVTGFTYDNADQLLTTTDARGTTLAYSYDGLGRRTAVYEGSTSGTKRADWTYDTLANGQPTSSTRYVNGNAYTSAVNGYDARYRSLGSTVTIPAAEGNLAGSYKMNSGYTDTGLPLLASYPAAGGLAAETLRYSYDAGDRLAAAQTGLSTLLTAATYSAYDEPLQYTLQSATGKQVAQTLFYEDGTRRLTRSVVDRTVSPLHLADVNYTYDAAGNVTRIADTPVGGTADTQCFAYDHLRRLTQAWTATNSCATGPATSVVGGPAPYWQEWTYDKTGNRLTEANYNPTTGAAVTSTSAYPAAGAARPHALSTVTTGAQVNSFAYDSGGNTTGRTVGGSAQALSWDAEGHLAKVTEGAKTTEFLYDADGGRLIRRDPDAVTLYLGGTELKLTRSTGAVSATRFYKLGTVTAVRTAAGLTFEAADRNGTAQLSVDADDLTVTQRRYLPFGELRGTAPTWPTEKGFVGGTVDAATALTHLGAREYDPDTGRLVSVDPVIDHNDPQQMNGYAYSDNTPITESDPDGLWSYDQNTGHYCDSCGGYDAQIVIPKKKKKSSKKSTGSSSGSGYYCDSCDYSRQPKKVYPGDLRKQDNAMAAEARRLAREYAAKKAREAAAKKARLAAKAVKQKAWNDCVSQYGPSRTAKCGPNPANAGKTSENLVTHLWKRVYLTWSLCAPGTRACGKVKFNSGKLKFITAVTSSPAKPGVGSLFPTIGYSHRAGADTEKQSVSVSAGRYGVGFGYNSKGIAWSDWDISVGTNPAGGWLGTENSGISIFGVSTSKSVGSWCPDAKC